DPELLVVLRRVVSQRRWIADQAATRVEGGQVKGEPTVEPDVSKEDARPGTVHVRHRRELPRGRSRHVEGSVGIALRGIGRLPAVAVHEPAPGAATDSLPIGERAR